MPAREEFVEVNGCKVRLQRAGKGAPVLFLHGANGPAIWVPFFDKLAEKYEVIAPDHPTYGKSGDPDWLEDIGDLAFFYLDFMKALDLEGVHLLGHSMGGWLAMEIAIRDTARLASVTLVAPAGIRVKGHPPADIFKLTPPEMVPLVYAGEEMRKKMLDMLAQPKSDAELDDLIRTRTASARLCWHPRLYNPKLARWLHRIDVPTQIVWGDSDGLLPPVLAGELGKLIPDAKVVMIDKCGHAPQVEKPDALLSAISNFAPEHVA